jgi:antitoxin CptB
MRSIRRGMRECDLILGDFARRALAALSPAELDLYEALLDEPDGDILLWITGTAPPPRYGLLVERIRAGAVNLGDP